MTADRPPAELKLTVLRMFPFAAPNISLGALGIVVFVSLPPYFSGHLGVPMSVIGVVWMLVRLLDVPVDVLLALGMDRTRTPIGRYRPWLIVGAPILMAGLYMLFMAPSGFDGIYLFVWLAALYLGNSIVSLAHQAWAASLTRHYHERSRIFGVINAVGVAGVMAAMAVLIGGPAFHLSNAQAVRDSGWFIILAVPFGVAVAALTTPERLAPDQARAQPPLKDYFEILAKPDLLRLFLVSIALTLGPGWMAAIYLFFFEASRGFSGQEAYILLAVYILAGIPGAFATAALARRVGKHRTLMVTTTAFSLGLFSIFIVPKGDIALYVPMMFFEGVMASGFGMMVQAMLADVGDEIRLRQGRQRMSLVFAVNTLASKIAAAGAIGLTFPLLQALGFNPAEGAVNTPAAIHNLDMAFLIGPIVFVMAGGACVIGWRLDAARHGEIRAALEVRDAEDELAAALAATLARPPLDPEIVTP
ncbi:MAG TPA: MFS transporter [Caulobacteraceae bacterium]|jgi:Na+/melibiose symporter-like transporter|nr:MFS transporter [Caulobacteraceae bacterium]